MAKAETGSKRAGAGTNLGLEEKLWAAADKMRGHMDPSEYKHVALGLIFLKYISDAFDERRDQLGQLIKEPQSEYYVDAADERPRSEVLEDRDLVETIRRSITIDWTSRESVRAKLRATVKRLLRKHGYPPDRQEQAVKTILEPTEVVCRDWVA